MPEANFDVMIDRECTLIKELLAPGRWARDEARGRIRTLLAMEAHVAEEVEISERDITRIEKALKGEKDWKDIFPRLTTIATEIVGTSVDLKVHFTKKQGMPVRHIAADDPTAAAAVRTIDLQKRFRYTRAGLAQQLGMNGNDAKRLRDHLGIEVDPELCHVFEFNRSKHPCFSDQTLIKMRKAWEDPEVKAAVKAAQSGRRRRP